MSNKKAGAGGKSVVPRDISLTMDRAVQIAEEYGHGDVSREHLLLALIEEADVEAFLVAASIAADDIAEPVRRFLSRLDLVSEVDGEPPLPRVTADAEEVASRTASMSRFVEGRKATPMHMLWNLAKSPYEDSPAVIAVLRVGVTPAMIGRWLSHGTIRPMISPPDKRKRVLNDADAEGADTPSLSTEEEARTVLSKYCADLNALARDAKIDPLIGREFEVERMVQIIARRTKNNPLLIGEPGVGKTAMVEGLALLIERGEVPDAIKGHTIWSLDVGGLLAGTRFRGDFEDRLKQVLKALAIFPRSILFIDEIQTVIEAGAGGKGALDFANMIKPALARGELRCIGSLTFEDFRKHFERDRAMMRRFKRVEVAEPSPDDTKRILRGLRSQYEAHHGLPFTDEALDAAVTLTTKFVHTGHLPDKAIDVLDNAGARQRILPADKRVTVIGVTEIEEEVARITKIPTKEVGQAESDRLRNLNAALRSVVFDQERAIDALDDAIFVSRAGLRDADKPSGCFLFTGPTGVGKTEAAKALARTLGIKFLRFDMSEYMEKHSVSRLIGAPPGYVGFGDGASGSGLLTNAIDEHPYSVLLLDEVEKAHPDLLNILLQVMDNGKLTSGAGKPVDFRNVIIIMTSNAGVVGSDREPIGFISDYSDSGVDEDVVKRTFTPEFRNRLDAVVAFDRLRPTTMIRIVDKFLGVIDAQAAERDVVLDVDMEARTWLAEKGYDPAYGARPLARVLHREIKVPLSRMMLVGDLEHGGVAEVRVVDGRMVVEARALVVA